MSVRCRECVCNIIRKHYLNTRQNEYKLANKEWCKLNNLDEDYGWRKFMFNNTIKTCPGISKFINICFKK